MKNIENESGSVLIKKGNEWKMNVKMQNCYKDKVYQSKINKKKKKIKNQIWKCQEQLKKIKGNLI